MSRGSVLAVIVLGVVLIGAYLSVFIVFPQQQALVLRFGEVRRAITDAGFYFKVPIVNNVVYIDKRILDLDVPAQEVIASDQKRLVVDAFARYRIGNPVLFYQTVGNLDSANQRLSTFLQSALRSVLADASFQAVVRDQRDALMRRIRTEVDTRASSLGISVVDVRIRRADLPQANSEAIYRRMQTERQREATEIRAQGEEASRRIRAQADREATVIVAEATAEAARIRGEGEAEANRILAGAYSRDPDFFAFYRSLQAYEDALGSDNTSLVLSPDSEFFRYFNSEAGAGDLSLQNAPRSSGTEMPPARSQDGGSSAAPAPVPAE